MSYILDALKKAERKRPPGPVPDLFTVQGPQPPAERRVRPAVVSWVAGVAVLAGLAVWAWRGDHQTPVAPQPVPVPAPGQTVAPGPTAAPVVPRPVAPAAQTTPARPRRGQTPSRPTPPALSPAAPPSAPASGAPQPAVPVAAPPPPAPVAPVAPVAPSTAAALVAVPAKAAAPPAASAPESLPAPASPAAPVVPEAPVPAASETEEEPSVVPAAPPAEPAPPPDGRVVTVDELPERVRALAAKLALSGHVWSEDAELRMITVQDRIVREGEEAATGVRLEQITRTGAVFTAAGWRFRLGGL